MFMPNSVAHTFYLNDLENAALKAQKDAPNGSLFGKPALTVAVAVAAICVTALLTALPLV